MFKLFTLAAFALLAAGCSAPHGPVGGAHLNAGLLSLHHKFAPVECEGNGQIEAPHSKFHPLPTRPVFSPPVELAPLPTGAWPTLESPAPSFAPPPEAVDVHAPRPAARDTHHNHPVRTTAAIAPVTGTKLPPRKIELRR